MEFGQSLAYGLKGRVSLERVVFTGRAASLKKRRKRKTPRLILCSRIPAVSVAVEDCILYLL